MARRKTIAELEYAGAKKRVFLDDKAFNIVKHFSKYYEVERDGMINLLILKQMKTIYDTYDLKDSKIYQSVGECTNSVMIGIRTYVDLNSAVIRFRPYGCDINALLSKLIVEGAKDEYFANAYKTLGMEVFTLNIRKNPSTVVNLPDNVMEYINSASDLAEMSRMDFVSTVIRLHGNLLQFEDIVSPDLETCNCSVRILDNDYEKINVFS